MVQSRPTVITGTKYRRIQVCYASRVAFTSVSNLLSARGAAWRCVDFELRRLRARGASFYTLLKQFRALAERTKTALLARATVGNR